jgi:hypothetical protein
MIVIVELYGVHAGSCVTAPCQTKRHWSRDTYLSVEGIDLHG